YQGRNANIVLSKEGSLQTILLQPYTDSSFYSFEGSVGYEYFSTSGIESFLNQLDSLGLDSNFNFLNFFRSLQNWYPVYRFAANVNSPYTLFQKDTSISSYNIRFKYAARRNNDQTINTAIGTFNCKKFTIQWEFSYLVGSFPVPLFSIEDTNWIAPNNWLVKAYQPSKAVDLSLLGIPPFYIPGRTIDIIDQIVSVSDEQIALNDFYLFQNYPNPFNPTTKIRYSIPGNAETRYSVSLRIYDLLGNEVATLVNEYRQAGIYEVEFNASEYNLTSGVYFYRIAIYSDKLQPEKFSSTRKLILIK
ncbi:MAG: T9SS type A sorting domain-containing protein, partial [Ignavibacterium sp.]|uniref:T9SS type A sorting domain-containing protein n=1 Tax=Ignavibacterium sp. TaxID=2651167 RepID=UPI00404913D4